MGEMMIVQPFIHINEGEESSQSISGYGASFQVNVSNSLKAVTGYKISQQQMFNNGILSDSASAGGTSDLEIGFVQSLANNNNVFARFSNTQIQDLAASDKTFGFKDTKADGWTIGYEARNDFGDFTLGVSKPNQFSSGTVSLVTPTGRTKAGDILYTETEFAVSSDNKLERFFAYNYENNDIGMSFGMVEDRYNQGKIGAAKFDFSLRF